MPSRGAMAGAKEDLKRAKEAGKDYNPTTVGAAWTHNFLNQKVRHDAWCTHVPHGEGILQPCVERIHACIGVACNMHNACPCVQFKCMHVIYARLRHPPADTTWVALPSLLVASV